MNDSLCECLCVCLRVRVWRVRVQLNRLEPEEESFFQIVRILSVFYARGSSLSVLYGACTHTLTQFISVYLCVCVCERERGCVCISPLLIQRFFISVRVRPVHALSEEGDCNKLCNFSAVAVAFKIKLALKSPLPHPLPLLSFLCPLPLPRALSLFLAQQESLEKKRGFYSASPCTPSPSPGFLKPIHALSVCFQSPISALWGLSPSLLLLLLLLFLRLGGRSFFLRGFPVIAGCNN